MGGVPPPRISSHAPRDRRLTAVAVVLLAAALGLIAAIVFAPLSPDASGQRRLAAWLVAVHRTWMPHWVTFGLIEFASNVVMFVPLGFLGAIVFVHDRRAVIGACVAFSAAVESVQWILLPHRQADWRDVLANSLGAAAGIALAAGLLRLIDGRRLARERRHPRDMPQQPGSRGSDFP